MMAEAMRKLRSDYFITPYERRSGTIWHYHLPNGREIGVYLLLWNVARLYVGDIADDRWERGYDYGSPEEAVAAAEAWFDTDKPPPGPWIREHGEERKK
jgi:hypothetical protein